MEQNNLMGEEAMCWLFFTTVFTHNHQIFGYPALSGKMLLVRIFENNKIDAHFKAG